MPPSSLRVVGTQLGALIRNRQFSIACFVVGIVFFDNIVGWCLLKAQQDATADSQCTAQGGATGNSTSAPNVTASPSGQCSGDRSAMLRHWSWLFVYSEACLSTFVFLAINWIWHRHKEARIKRAIADSMPPQQSGSDEDNTPTRPISPPSVPGSSPPPADMDLVLVTQVREPYALTYELEKLPAAKVIIAGLLAACTTVTWALATPKVPQSAFEVSAALLTLATVVLYTVSRSWRMRKFQMPSQLMFGGCMFGIVGVLIMSYRFHGAQTWISLFTEKRAVLMLVDNLALACFFQVVEETFVARTTSLPATCARLSLPSVAATEYDDDEDVSDDEAQRQRLVAASPAAVAPPVTTNRKPPTVLAVLIVTSFMKFVFVTLSIVGLSMTGTSVFNHVLWSPQHVKQFLGPLIGFVIAHSARQFLLIVALKYHSALFCAVALNSSIALRLYTVPSYAAPITRRDVFGSAMCGYGVVAFCVGWWVVERQKQSKFSGIGSLTGMLSDADDEEFSTVHAPSSRGYGIGPSRPPQLDPGRAAHDTLDT